MNNTLSSPRRDRVREAAAEGPRVALNAEAVRAAYRRKSVTYDRVFGPVTGPGRRQAVAMVNSLPGDRVLEVGVGTGLSLPLYRADKTVTGIDLSAEMLALARQRVREHSLRNVAGLLELDAEATGFADASFDIAVAMFVASVVPNPRLLLAEMRRVVRPGGNILFVNHFAAERGPRWWIERTMAKGSRLLGWHPDFALEQLFTASEMPSVRLQPVRPFGLFTLAQLTN